MYIEHNKQPIEKAFAAWINNFPESFHPMDMQRFYSFVKTVCRYSRKDKDGRWLENKIREYKSNLSDKDIEIYCEKFEELQKFHRAVVIQVYGYPNY